MRSDDLAPLLSFAGRFGAGGDPGRGGGDVGFHMGTVTAWDSSTGENTLSVAGATITNVPTLSTSDSFMVKPGDQIGLLRFKSTYFVLGRITPPGSSDAFASRTATVAEGDITTSDEFGDMQTTVGPVVEDVYIGSSRRCIVWVSALVSAFDCIGFAGVRVSGASDIEPTEQDSLAAGWGAAESGTVYVNGSRAVFLDETNGLRQGSNTFTMEFKTSLGVSGSAEFSNRTLTVMPY